MICEDSANVLVRNFYAARGSFACLASTEDLPRHDMDDPRGISPAYDELLHLFYLGLLA